MAAHSNQWSAGSAAQAAPMPQQQQQGDGYGLQAKPMGLKVQYTFDKDSQVNCLARWPHILHVQTVPLDDRNSIGVVDLRTCLQAVAQCSPEIVNQQDYDYTVYASDYSEPDVPLVGQGMLSRGLDPNSDPQSQQLVTGRVTRNLMALFSKGNSDTLEVRLKLTPVPRMHRAEAPRSNMQPQHHHAQSFHSQPDTTQEWITLIHSNPALGQPSNVSRFPSPSLPPARMENTTPHMRYAEPRPEHSFYQQSQTPPSTVPAPVPAPAEEPPPQLPQLPQQQQQQAMQPTPSSQLPPPPTSDAIMPEKPVRPSRPTSRASRSRVPTGRPRGRPRKKPLEGGHTSGAEMTDADDAPQRKRAKVVTQVDYNTTAPFASHPDSLRVAASTSGSLRNMRPVGLVGRIPSGNPLQDVPRAPTPVPDFSQQQKRATVTSSRKGSMSGFDTYQLQPNQPSLQTSMSVSMSMTQDARSPTDTNAPSPDPGYTPRESPADLGSSPPVPRTSAYLQSSPAPSSPTLPPVDSGFMSGGIDDFFDEDDFSQELPRQDGQPDMLPKLPLQKPVPQRSNNQQTFSQDIFSQPHNFLFHEVTPGPMDVLPQNSLFKPHGRAKTLNRMYSGPVEPVVFEPKGPPPPRELPPRQPPTRRSLQRSNTAPIPMPPRSEPNPVALQLAVSKASFEVPIQSVEKADTPKASLQAEELPPQSNHGRVQLAINANGVASISTTTRPSQQRSAVGTPQAAAPEMKMRNVEPPLTEPANPTEPESTGAQVTVPQITEPQVTEVRTTDESVTEPAATEPRLLKAEPEATSSFLAPPIMSEPTRAQESAPASQVLQAPVLLPTMRPSEFRSKALPPPPVPASDPVVQTFLTLPQLPEVPQSEGFCPLGEDGQPKHSKNLVKKQSIKDRLETAIAKGEMPPFCNNCGAIETPTWRKIWTQEHQGVPGFHELSDKPGCVTCIDILERCPEGQPTLYRLVKKNLGRDDLRIDWKELLLCNPCGIWLAKFKGHRPPDRWDKDFARLGQPRKKRGAASGGNPRSKRQRSKSNGEMNPTSDPFLMTDGPNDQDDQDGEDDSRSRRQSTQFTEGDCEQNQPTQPALINNLGLPDIAEHRAPGSTHSRGSGTFDSPIALEEDHCAAPSNLGDTRRLLFPSPRKDGQPKILGELAVNIVRTAPDCPPKPRTGDNKENMDMDLVPNHPATPTPRDDDDLDQELFGTPPLRPSTPPPKSAKHGTFKTPTRPTPSHRPITRSVSRSIRSVKQPGAALSPSQALFSLQRTPSRTPRSVGGGGGAINFSLGLTFSATKRRTPRPNPVHAHFALGNVQVDSPFTATINQLLSEANEFTSGSPSHGLADMDLSSLPNLHSDDVMQQLAGHNGQLDFGHFLSTDMGLPSSPPLLRHHNPFQGMDEAAMADMWAKLSAPVGDDAGEIKEDN